MRSKENFFSVTRGYGQWIHKEGNIILARDLAQQRSNLHSQNHISLVFACLLVFTFENQSINKTTDKPYQSSQCKSRDVSTDVGKQS